MKLACLPMRRMANHDELKGAVAYLVGDVTRGTKGQFAFQDVDPGEDPACALDHGDG